MSDEKADNNAVVALVLGIVGIFFSLTAPVAIWLGLRELKEIREGRSAAAGQGFAMAGLILGIIGTCFLLLGCLCGAAYALLVIGLISSVPFINSMNPTFAHTEVGTEMMRIHIAQKTFFERDLDHDGVKDYAGSLDELARFHAFADGRGKPSVPGYVFEIEGDERGYAARAAPTRKEFTERFFIDESGILRSASDGKDAGPQSPPDSDPGPVPAEKDGDDDDDDSGS